MEQLSVGTAFIDRASIGALFVHTLLLALLSVAGSAHQARGQEQRPPLRPELQDAELNDVFFLDSQRGWAAGQLGSIWATTDGGLHWQLQPTPTKARLESLWFIDQQTGWAVGGRGVPYTGASQGVLLFTLDGGQTWSELKRHDLPALRRVQFNNRTRGWLVGDISGRYAAGLFTTENGGRSWTPVDSLQPGPWLGGDFTDAQSGTVFGSESRVAVVRQQRLKLVELLSTEASAAMGRDARAVAFSGRHDGYLAGDGGMLLKTLDQGLSWQPPPGPLPEAIAQTFDWRSVAVRGRNCWLAGSPGTHVVTSADGGHTWHAAATDQTLPLNAVCFADQQHGWAVGALGTILATTDGGQSWHAQRSPGKRVAVLAIHGQADRVPLELIAQLAGGDGYRVAVTVLTRDPGPSSIDSGNDRLGRLQDAVARLGGNTAEIAWRFPKPRTIGSSTALQLLEHWERSNPDSAEEAIQRYLVRQIRIWRPEVLLTDASSLSQDAELSHLVNQFVLRAVEQAATQEVAPTPGLDPWTVKKVFACLSEGDVAEVQLATSGLQPRLGGTLADAVTIPRGLIARAYRPVPPSLGFRLDRDQIPQGRGQDDFFSGLHLTPGGPARRAVTNAQLQNSNELRRVARQQRLVRALFESVLEDGRRGESLLAQLGDLTRGLDSRQAGQVFFELGSQLRSAGHWEAAADAYTALLRQHANHELAPCAVQWLIQYHASGEAALVSHRPASQRQSAMLARREPSNLTETLGQVLPDDSKNTAPHRSRRTGADPGSTSSNDHATQAVAFGRLLQQSYPELYGLPEVGLPLAAAQRRNGQSQEALRYLTHLSQQRTWGPWPARAAAEAWQQRPVGTSPLKLWTVGRAVERPRLDGQLDDAVWTKCPRVELDSGKGRVIPTPGDDADEAADCEAMMAVDGEFLYLAIRCRSTGPDEPTRERQPRRRDASLARSDHVELWLDVDRDFVSFFQLAVDEEGRTHDACWGQDAWNPTWYVATSRDDTFWTVEAAIPLVELCQEAPSSGTTWAVGMVRHHGDGKLQRFEGADAHPPGRMNPGLLKFP
jgi:photosystem II stability/assembly factor-like uncharacterized protein